MSTMTQQPHFYHLDQPPKKRKRFTRSATGCKSCRVQRVKCPEGPIAKDGKKVTCKRCWETDTACFYPVNGRTVRKKGGDDSENWERAAEADIWQSGGGVVPKQGDWDWDTFLSDMQVPVPNTSAGATLEPLPDVEVGAGDITQAYPSTTTFDPAIIGVPDIASYAMAPIQPTTVSPYGQPLENTLTPSLDWLKALLSPSPPPILNTFTISSLLTPDSLPDTARPVVSYFEQQGCNEIVSASKSKHNWIFTQLFPRLFATLTIAPTTTDSLQGLVRDWLQACLVQLSYVHRSNVELDVARRYIWRSESDKARQRANYALLRAKVKYPDGQWKTEEYLMGFFVRCMADMLAANKLVIDDSTAFELPLDKATPFYPSLQDLIALYSVIDHACTPLNPTLAQTPRFLMPENGSDWVELFVGFSRRIIIKLAEVTGLVIHRWSLIHQGTDSGVAGMLLKTRAERLLTELGDGWDWEEHLEDVGQPDRIQRGNGVMRSALQTILICEILNLNLDEPRIRIAQERAIELVADAEPSSLGGFQWPLTILAIYCRDLPMRDRITTVLHQALELSFGLGYRGTDEVLDLCWEVLDSKGAYPYGIAPWRDALAAFERSLFV